MEMEKYSLLLNNVFCFVNKKALFIPLRSFCLLQDELIVVGCLGCIENVMVPCYHNRETYTAI